MIWTLAEAISGCRAQVVSGDPATLTEGAAIDSRGDVRGRLFVGLPGEHDDGGAHAPSALARGAAAAIVGESAWTVIADEVRRTGAAVAVAQDPLAVLQDAGRRVLARSGATVVGITGSVGKTTTKDVLVAMLRAAGVRVQGTVGNRNTEVGVPLSMFDLDVHTEVAVLEMGMRGVGQIANLVVLAPPTVACITAIAPVHLEVLGSLEAIAAAKAEIFHGLGAGGTAVVPADEPLLDPFVHALGTGVRVERFDRLPDGVMVNLDKAWQLQNAAAAFACARALGRLPPHGAVVEVVLSGMRGQERRVAGGGTIIEDCYNANPVAMRAALRDLAERPGRRVAVLGDMMELGPGEARFHREIGELVADLGIDLLVAVGPRAVNYMRGAVGVPSVGYADCAEAVRGLPGLLAPGDIVLVKGSRSVALEQVCEAIT